MEELDSTYNGSNLKERLEQQANKDDFSYKHPINIKIVHIPNERECDFADGLSLLAYLNNRSQSIADYKQTQAYKPECMTIADTLEIVKLLLFERSNKPGHKIDYDLLDFMHVPVKKWKV